MTTRKPVQVFPLSVFIEEELNARGWSRDHLAFEMGNDTEREFELNRCTLAFIFDHPPDGTIAIGQDTALRLAHAFGTGPEVWLNLDKAWRDSLPEEKP